MKDRFTPEEWHLLKLLPFLSYSFVCDSLSGVKRLKLDGAHDVFRTWLGHPTVHADGFHREVALDTPQGEWDGLLAEAQDPFKIEASAVDGPVPPGGDVTLAIITRLLRIRGILSSKLIREQYEPFVLSVLRTSVLTPFASVPRKARDRTQEAISTLGGMLLEGEEGFGMVRVSEPS